MNRSRYLAVYARAFWLLWVDVVVSVNRSCVNTRWLQCEVKLGCWPRGSEVSWGDLRVQCYSEER